MEHLRLELEALAAQQRLRSLIPRAPQGIEFVQAGRRLINFGSNDYLGLAATRTAAAAAAGSGASALVCGWTEHHQQLAERIAQFESTAAAVIFPSGFAACSGTIATLSGREDLILSDALNHASLIDGCRLSRAQCLVYPHRDVAAVERLLQQHAAGSRQVWIVTDGVFSMDGDVAPLGELCDLADRYAAALIVDEAHGTGVLGDAGSGACEAAGVKQRVAVRIGTLSKAIGSQGGFVAASQLVIDYLINRCRTLIYSTALSPTAVIAAAASFDAIANEPHRRQRVTGWARRLRAALQLPGEGWQAGVPIIPIVVGSDQAALEASKQLFEQGFFVPAIRPPTVPEGTARLRISLSADHSDEMISGLIQAVRDL